MVEQEGIELPKGWVNSSLGEVCDKPIQRKPEVDEHFYYIDIGSVNRFSKKIENASEIIGIDAPSRARKIVDEGDVIVSMTRPNLNAVAKINTKYDKQVASTGFDVLKPILLEADWVFSIVKSEKFIQSVSGITQGALYPACKAADIRNYEFALPPLPEQQRIVAKLDSLLAQVGSIQQRLNNLPEIIKRFRQSVLAAAVSGKLTEQWREDNKQTCASLILADLTKVRLRKCEKEINNGDRETKRLLTKLNKHKPQLPNVEIPKTWIWTSFMASMEKVVDCHNKTAPYIDDGIPLIRTPDIRDGKISLKGCMYISKETYDYWSKRCPPKSGDIIFTREAPMGQAGIVPDDTVLCMGQRMMLLRPMKEFIDPKYILLNILSLNFQERMNKDAIGTGVKHLRVADIESLSYPLAPIAEQAEIVRLVEQYFALADTLEKNLANAKQRVDNLTQSILAKAFRGELVPQDPNDEPAEKLLERIKAARLEAEAIEKAAKKAAKAGEKKQAKRNKQSQIQVSF